MLRRLFFWGRGKSQPVFLALIFICALSTTARGEDSTNQTSQNSTPATTTTVSGQEPANQSAQNSTPATALVTQAGTIDLNKIVVTASRSNQLVSDSSSRVTVVDSNTVENNTSKTVDQLLENVPGVDVLRPTGLTYTTPTVSLRGFGMATRGRTLVLVDGIPYNDIYDGTVQWNSIPTESVQRIEVVPGSASALYGAAAMGGVINIITKTPKKLETEFDSEYGTYNTRSFNLGQQNKLGNFSYLVSGGYFKTDGYVAVINPQSYDIKRSRESNNVNVKMRYDFDDNDSIGLGYRHYYENANLGREYYYSSNNIDNLNFNLKKIINNIDILGTLYFEWEQPSYTSDVYPYTANKIDYVNKDPQTEIGGSLLSNIHFSDSNTFTVGTDLRWGEADSKDDYQSTVRTVQAKGEQDSLGIYLQDELKFLEEKLILNLGGRWDYWRNFNGYSYDDTLSPKATSYKAESSNAFSPKVGLVYHLTKDTTLRASAGEAFRPPTLYDLYRTWKYYSTTYQANPNLGPEKAKSYEIGFDQTLWEKLLGRFTFYYNDVSNYIYSVTAGTNIKQRQNVGDVAIWGLEPELRYSLTKELTLFTNYTFDSSKIEKYINPSLKGKYLTYTPRNKSSIGCSFQNPKLVNIDIVGKYIGSVFNDDANTQKLKGFMTLDITLSRKITENFEASLKLENLQGKQYQDYWGYLTPGRTITGSVKVKF